MPLPVMLKRLENLLRGFAWLWVAAAPPPCATVDSEEFCDGFYAEVVIVVVGVP